MPFSQKISQKKTWAELVTTLKNHESLLLCPSDRKGFPAKRVRRSLQFVSYLDFVITLAARFCSFWGGFSHSCGVKPSLLNSTAVIKVWFYKTLINFDCSVQGNEWLNSFPRTNTGSNFFRYCVNVLLPVQAKRFTLRQVDRIEILSTFISKGWVLKDLTDAAINTTYESLGVLRTRVSSCTYRFVGTTSVYSCTLLEFMK